MKYALIALLLIIIALGFLYRNDLVRMAYSPTPASVSVTPLSAVTSTQSVSVVAENLDTPWEIAFLPDGDLLVTERPGTLRRIGKKSLILTIDGVREYGEGGLLGMALHPKFLENGWIYLYMSTAVSGGTTNRVVRYRLDGDALVEPKTIIEKIPGAIYHDGGRIAFGPDNYLYITTGDATQSDDAQDTSKLNGKILRVKDDGSVPDDNPFGNAVWSYGHRNPQGLAWDNVGNLWATEHGRSGVLSGLDELNLIQKGKNYGWPEIQGDEKKTGMETPWLNSGPNETWAPSGIAYEKESSDLFFAGLRGEALYRVNIITIGGDVSTPVAYLKGTYGRLRAVVVGPDGSLYVSTSNRDGRGTVREGDDKILKIDPTSL